MTNRVSTVKGVGNMTIAWSHFQLWLRKTLYYGCAVPISPFPSGRKHLVSLSVPHQSIFQPFWHRRLYQMSHLSRLLGLSPEQDISANFIEVKARTPCLSLYMHAKICKKWEKVILIHFSNISHLSGAIGEFDHSLCVLPRLIIAPQ